MRELKFRAFDGEKMRYDITGFEHGQDNEMTAVFIDGDFYLINGCDHSSASLVGNRAAHVMQYTGLKDKNGKEIYEGDLLSCNFNQTHEVIWESYFAQYKTKHLTSGVVSDVYKDVLEEAFEIIGNTHENKELLEG